jgi:hypothetical protein
MYSATVDLSVIGGLRCEYEVATANNLATVKAAVDAWLKAYGLYVYQWDDVFVSIGQPIVGYTRGNDVYDAVAWIKETA